MARAKQSKEKAPRQVSVTCPDCHEALTFVNEKRGPLSALTDAMNNAWQSVVRYGWWAVCEKCGQTWHHDEHAPSMYVLRDTIEGRGTT